MSVNWHVITPLAITTLLLLWAIRDQKHRMPILAFMAAYFLLGQLIFPLIQGVRIVTSLAGIGSFEFYDSLPSIFFFCTYIAIAALYFFASTSGSSAIDTNSKRYNIIFFLALLILIKKQFLTVVGTILKYNKGAFILGNTSTFLYFGSSFLYPILTLAILVYYWKMRGGLWPLAKTPTQARFLLLINVCLGITIALYLTAYLSTTVMRLTVGIPADASFAVALARGYAMGITNIALGAFIIATEIMRFISWRTPSADDTQPQTAS